MKERLNWGLFSKYRIQLYGIATLMIMAFHSQSFLPISGAINYLNFGVDIFLVLSGMSLYYSYSEDNNYSSFMKKRCERTLIPYLFIGFFFWLWQDLLVQFNIAGFLFDISGLSLLVVEKDGFLTLGRPDYWYVAFIMGMYVVYPLIYKAFFCVGEKKRRINFALLFVLSVALTVLIRLYADKTYDRAEIWLTRIPSFLLGCYIGKAVKEKRRFRLYDYLLIFSCIPFKLIIKLISPVFDDLILHRYLGVTASVLICFAVVVFFELVKISPMQRMFSFFGKISLEEYLIHCMICNAVVYYVPDLRMTDSFTFLQKALMYLAVLTVSTVLSIIFSKVLSIIMKKHKSDKKA